MGRSSQRKGRNGEKELSVLLNEYGFNTRPGRPLSFGSEADVVGLPSIHIESKRCQQLRLSEWMKQAVADSEKFKDGLPTLFHRRDREEWMVTMRVVDWIEIYKKSINDK